MDLHLEFGEGVMTGEGNDDVGPFVVQGQYNATSLECSWRKTYVGQHAVHYHGFREGKGIWGTWEISPRSHGGFQIWPKQTGEVEAQAEAAKQKQPVEEKVSEPVVLPTE